MLVAASISAPVSGSSGCRGAVLVGSGPVSSVVAGGSSVVVIADSFRLVPAVSGVHVGQAFSGLVQANWYVKAFRSARPGPGPAAAVASGLTQPVNVAF